MTDGKEPASPCQSDVHGQQFRGLTIREYYAAMAMQGILAGYCDINPDGLQSAISKYSVSYADALIAELNKQTT